jgi:hypothetical protein
MTNRNLPEKQAVSLATVVHRYRASNDRFERWLNERDAEQRQRQSERLGGIKTAGFESQHLFRGVGR